MKRIGVVSIVPPSASGIARFSEIIYSGDEKFKIFSDSNSLFNNYSEIWRDLIDFKLSSLLFVLGNSDHCIPTARLLRQFAGFPAVRAKISIQIHDPVLTNIAFKILNSGENQFFKYYNLRIDPPGVSCIYDAYESRGITGLSSLLDGIKIENCIVHSNAAHNILVNELSAFSASMPKNIMILPHPVFDTCQYLLRSERIYDIGIFGMMDNGNKLSNIALNIIDRAYSQGAIKTCVCAGYNVLQYFNCNPDLKKEYIQIVDNPSDCQMSFLMSQTIMGLQLRRQNTGESSGVIPMLISQGCTPIVSNIGAFSEYPADVAKHVDNSDITEQSLAAIRQILSHETDKDHFRRYCDSYSAIAFRDAIAAALS